MSQSTSELCEKEVAGGSFGNTPCRAQEQESSQCTSTQMEQTCSSGTLLWLGRPPNVGVNPRNKIFHEGALGLRAMLNGITEGSVNELTLLCSGMSDSSFENVSSTSINQGSLS